MRPPALFRVLGFGTVGLRVGWLFAISGGDATLSPSSQSVLVVVNFPAILLARAWLGLGLPPHGEASLAVGFYATIVQWFLLGLLAGAAWIWYGRSHEKRDA